MDVTFIIALVGVAAFWLGIRGRLYMSARVQGSFHKYRNLPDLRIRYEELVNKEGAPKWPLIVSPWFLLLGVVIAFGAVLSAR